MATPRSVFSRTPLAGALALWLVLPVAAQTSTTALSGVTVTGKTAPVLDIDRADVGGLDAALARTPQSVGVLGADLLAATASSTLSQAIKLDASLADAYNTVGYIESLAVRGFLLEQGNNFQRNGLPISNLAPLAVENLERIEVLKGVAGLQAGVSAPGGLVNYVTKTPQAGAFTHLALGADGNGGSAVHLDHNGVLGAAAVRVNLVGEQLRSVFDGADGQRALASVAVQIQPTSATTLKADLEVHQKRQPSVPGLGLLDGDGDGVGEILPPARYARLNLNNQSWSQPFAYSGSQVQLALEHTLNARWMARLAVGAQRSVIHDRLAFPDGCSNATNYVYPGLCANGDVDVYDYRSENEERQAWSWDARVRGRVDAWGVAHALQAGLGARQLRADLNPTQAYNYVGSTNIDQPRRLTGDGTALDLNTNSRERALDVYASLSSQWSAPLQTFMGARSTQVHRSSERSDGSRAVDLVQTVTTPWAGVTWSLAPDAQLYASWGLGAEMEVVPNRASRFSNAGAVLPTLKSEQTELGGKWQAASRLLVTAAWFQIDKPFADDEPTPAGVPMRVAGAKAARHQGLELGLSGQLNAQWSVQASLMALDARITRAVDTSLVGQRVTNVPAQKASVYLDYKVPGVPGLALGAQLTSESGKTVHADGSVRLPASWQLDGALRYQHRWFGHWAHWSLNVENLTDRSYWREAPTQYWGGVYLYPSTPRTLRARLRLEF